MFRCVFYAARTIRSLTIPYINAARIVGNDFKQYSTLNTRNVLSKLGAQSSLSYDKRILEISNNLTPIPARTVTKFSLNKGKRKTVKAATRRFFRLHWGIWIRPMVGRKKKLWKKSPPQKRRLRQHVFCNSTQSTMLDKMVTKYWKRPKYYVDDPYAPYHTREEFRITRTKPGPAK